MSPERAGLRVCVCIAVLFALQLPAGAARADYFTGMEAFRRGDYATALKELTPAAAKNNPDAIMILAKMYQGGFGVKKDTAKATELFKRAAELGDADAAYTYGIARAIGDGIQQDLGEGLKWLYIAQTLGSDKAQTYLKKLKMPPELTAEAKRAAYIWHAAYDKKRRAKLKAEEAADEARVKKLDAAAEKAEKKAAAKKAAEKKKAESADDADSAVDPAAK